MDGMPIRMIAMDIDGTLLNSTGHVSQQNARVIAEAQARGIQIVLVTGRRYDFARPIADSLPCDLHFITNNGAMIKSKDGVTDLRHLLPRETARKVLDATTEFRPGAAVIFDRPRENQVMMERADWDHPVRGGYLRRNREYIGVISPLTACLDGTDPIQIGYADNCGNLRTAMKLLENLPIANEYTLALTEYEKRDLSILDVLKRGVSKGAALEEWTQRLGIDREDVMAIGDNWNDREMLEFAGLPVVMGNSVLELKTRGWAVTLTNDEDGVAEAIRTHALGASSRLSRRQSRAGRQ
jgi:Cof subfamily protein (haloacid dehalogenase superfamily)